MFVGRMVLSVVVSLMLCIGARAQTQTIALGDTMVAGAISEIVNTLPGCSVNNPRGDPTGAVSAFIDIDCGHFTSSALQPGDPSWITVRLFSRMILATPWVVSFVNVQYDPKDGGDPNADAKVTVLRPIAGTISSTGNSTRNIWVEFTFLPKRQTAGTVSVTLWATVTGDLLPPPLPSCPSGPAIACNSDSDCGIGYRCATECASTGTCRRR